MRIALLDESLDFPNADTALDEPNGLLAAGGDLSVERLLAAYRNGIFPWYSDGEPLLWWSPSPRAVLTPATIHLSKSAFKAFNRSGWQVSASLAFNKVIQSCSELRQYAEGTWITDEMIAAYNALHRAGYAQSIEVWQANRLVGGLYGVHIGGVFFGESMFSRQSNASKAAVLMLKHQCTELGIELIDCQMESPHLARLGANTLARTDFIKKLKLLLDGKPHKKWYAERTDILNLM